MDLPVLADRVRGAASCPYQVDGACSVHTVRPMGCRVFFCQAGQEAWQRDLYERMLGELRRLHERFALPYRYAEWRGLLAEWTEVRSHWAGGQAGDGAESHPNTPSNSLG